MAKKFTLSHHFVVLSGRTTCPGLKFTPFEEGTSDFLLKGKNSLVLLSLFMRQRYLKDYILKDLKEKMVFIGGPRQIGKTTLSREIIGKKFISHYFNWDNKLHKKEIDFLVTVDQKPWFVAQVKSTTTNVSPQVFTLRNKLGIPFVYQVVKKNEIDELNNGVGVISAGKFLTGLV